MFKIESSKSGHPCAVYNGKYLHSTYDPEREAQKHLVSHIGARAPDTAVVVGPGLGYIGAELRKRGIFTIQVFLSALTYSAAVERGDVAWHPEGTRKTTGHAAGDPFDARALRSFLRSVLSDTDSVGLEVLSWSPCLDAFPDESEKALAAIADVVRESNANLTTIAAFGPRWFRNLCSNFRNIGSGSTVDRSCKHVVLAAAGPSLESAVPMLQELDRSLSQGRKVQQPRGQQPEATSCEIWAVGTALRPLLAAGIQPSTVVTTDAGYFALEHLNAARSSPNYCIAAPLTAARGFTRRGSEHIVLNQGSIIEQELFSRCRVPTIQLPANGTVAGTALELALRVCSGRVVLVGLDLGYRDIQPHARPHSFEHYLWRKESRLQPVYSMFAARAFDHSTRMPLGRRTTRQLETYAGWFRRRLAQLKHRVATLGPSAVELNIPELSRADIMRHADETLSNVTVEIKSHAPKGFTERPTPELTEQERSDVLDSLFEALETRLRRVAAIHSRAEFLALLHPQRFQRGASTSPSDHEDLQVLTYLNCRGVISCIRQVDAASFRTELLQAVKAARKLINEQKHEYRK